MIKFDGPYASRILWLAQAALNHDDKTMFGPLLFFKKHLFSYKRYSSFNQVSKRMIFYLLQSIYFIYNEKRNSLYCNTEEAMRFSWEWFGRFAWEWFGRFAFTVTTLTVILIV